MAGLKTLEKRVLSCTSNNMPSVFLPTACPLHGLVYLERQTTAVLRIRNKMFRVKAMVVRSPEKFDFYFVIQCDVTFEFCLYFGKRYMKC